MVVECFNLNAFNQVGTCSPLSKNATKYVSNPVKTDKTDDSNKAVVSKDGNTAIRNMALASLKLKKTAIVIQNGKEYNIKGKYKVIGELPTKEVNATWASRGYTDAPYKPNEKAQIIELTDKAKFVRTYDNKNSFKAGGWVMKYEDIKGLSPEEIADKFKQKYGEQIITLPNKNYNSMIDAVAELYMLGKAAKAIYSSLSTFSELAWWLCGAKQDVTIVGGSNG